MLIYYTSFHDQNPVHTRTVMQQIGYQSMFYTNYYFEFRGKYSNSHAYRIEWIEKCCKKEKL